jgi:hypothetical protein
MRRWRSSIGGAGQAGLENGPPGSGGTQACVFVPSSPLATDRFPGRRQSGAHSIAAVDFVSRSDQFPDHSGLPTTARVILNVNHPSEVGRHLDIAEFESANAIAFQPRQEISKFEDNVLPRAGPELVLAFTADIII